MVSCLGSCRFDCKCQIILSNNAGLSEAGGVFGWKLLFTLGFILGLFWVSGMFCG